MAYTKQTWTDNVSVLSGERFNHMEDGIKNAEKMLPIPNITIDTGVVAGDGITFDGTKYVKTAAARYIYDGTDAVRLGRMSYTSPSVDVGYTLFVQSDGKLGLETTNCPAAQILSTSEVFVDFNPENTNPKEYAGLMQNFYCMIGTSGIVRVNNQFPADADGVMYRYKTSAWVEGEIHTDGFLIVDVTSDTGEYGANLWLHLDLSALASDGDFIYIKAFPYKGSIYNETIGVNEVASTVGTLINEWLAKDYSGTTAPDNAGGNGCVGTGITQVAGGVDFMFRGGGTSLLTFSSAIGPAGKTVVMISNPTGGTAGLFGTRLATGFTFMQFQDGTFRMGSQASYQTFAGSTGIETLVGAYWDLSKTTIKGWLNNNTPASKASTFATNSAAYIGGSQLTTKTYMNGDIGQVRIFNGDITAVDRANLDNGGNYC
jgi:hypothetical protein